MTKIHIVSLAAVGLLSGLPLQALADDTLFTASNDMFTISGSVGLANISGGEYVYAGSHKMSQLDWESTGVTLYTAEIGADIDKNWSVKAKFSAGFGGDGHMVDYDWMSETHDEWSDRSVHPDTELAHYFTGSIEIDRDVYSNETTTLALGAGFRYSDVKWDAYGGSYIYSSGDPDFRDLVGEFPDGEQGISYQQKIPVGFLAANVEHTAGRFSFTGGLQGGLSFGIDDIDDHWMRNARFYDYMDAAPTIALNLGANYALTPSAAVYVSGSFERVFHAKGSMDMYDTTTGDLVASEDNAAGATFQAMSISVGLKGTF